MRSGIDVHRWTIRTANSGWFDIELLCHLWTYLRIPLTQPVFGGLFLLELFNGVFSKDFLTVFPFQIELQMFYIPPLLFRLQPRFQCHVDVIVASVVLICVIGITPGQQDEAGIVPSDVRIYYSECHLQYRRFVWCPLYIRHMSSSLVLSCLVWVSVWICTRQCGTVSRPYKVLVRSVDVFRE